MAPYEDHDILSRRELLRLAGMAWGAGMLPTAARGIPHSALPQEVERKMRLGLVTYNVARDWDLPTILRVCKEAGLEGVEFRTTHRHGVEPTLDAARRAEVRQMCSEAGLKQLSLGTVCEFHSPDPAEVRRHVADCAAFVKLAQDIGARGVKVRPNGLPKDVPVQKTLEQIGKALNECGRIGADHGVEIWVEVHGGGTSDPANMRTIMDVCGHPNVCVTWNSNGTDVRDGSVKQAYELLGRFIRCCHITDLWSNYPWRELMALLRADRYDRFMLCEVGTPVPPEAGTLFLRCYAGLWRELAR
ncbi:MAG: sugar phosphate isomerase/epimerase [Chthonomonadales bacterium]|nr:sugar phosphate isomerase/epimerase [Chthonomonadales bacterium]